MDNQQAVSEETPSPSIPRMTVDELNRFVVDFDRSKVFTSAHIPAESRGKMLGVVFMPVGLGALSVYSSEELSKVGIFFEYWDKNVGDRARGGYPMFFSVHVMHKDDWSYVTDKLEKLREVRSTHVPNEK